MYYENTPYSLNQTSHAREDNFLSLSLYKEPIDLKDFLLKLSGNSELRTIKKVDKALKINKTSNATQTEKSLDLKITKQNPSTKIPSISKTETYDSLIDRTYHWGTYKPDLINCITEKTENPISLGTGYLSFADGKLGEMKLYTNIGELVKDNITIDTIFHNGRSYSAEELNDKKNNGNIRFMFYKEEIEKYRQRWHSVTSYSYNPEDNKKDGISSEYFSLIYYIWMNDSHENLDKRYFDLNIEEGIIQIKNEDNKVLNYFKIIVHENDIRLKNDEILRYLTFTNETNPKNLLNNFTKLDKEGFQIHSLTPNLNSTKESNLVALQYILNKAKNYTIQIIHDNRNDFLSSDDYFGILSNIYQKNQKAFFDEYSSIFHLNENNKNLSSQQLTCGQSALSNLVSGIAYISTQFKAQPLKDSPNKEKQLYASTKSKILPAEGDLWTEGFHDVLLCKWNKDICLDIIDSWLSYQRDNGWIPNKIPLDKDFEDFKDPSFNPLYPPTIFMAISDLLDENKSLTDPVKYRLKLQYPKLQKWAHLFSDSYHIDEKFLFRWKETDSESIRKKYLISGIGDYIKEDNGAKRDNEFIPMYDLDLHVWQMLVTKTLSRLALLLEKVEDNKKYNELFITLNGTMYEKFLDKKNYTFNSVIANKSNITEEKLSEHIGYISLFPLFFGFITPNSSEFNQTLLLINDTNILWSDNGLRSLAKNDSEYNLQFEWRGLISTNFNYLTLKSLKVYYNQDIKGQEVYQRLRQNNIQNVCENKRNNGFFYQNYNPETGKGENLFPYNGWTSLITSIMHEIY